MSVKISRFRETLAHWVSRTFFVLALGSVVWTLFGVESGGAYATSARHAAAAVHIRHVAPYRHVAPVLHVAPYHHVTPVLHVAPVAHAAPVTHATSAAPTTTTATPTTSAAPTAPVTPTTSAASTTPVAPVPLPCKAKIDIAASTATVTTDCVGSDFYLTSWKAASNVRATAFPQHLFQTTDVAPWSVELPDCYYQVDFTERSAPPLQHSTGNLVIAAVLGGDTACATPPTSTTTTTSTSTTTTTVVQGTIATTIPGTTLPKSKGLQSSTTTSNPTTTIATASTAKPAQGTGQLAFTGANMARLVVLSVLALAAGGFLVVLSNRRKPVGARSGRSRSEED